MYINRVATLGGYPPVTVASMYNPPALSDFDFDPLSMSGESWNILFNTAMTAGHHVIIRISVPQYGVTHWAHPPFRFAFTLPYTVAGSSNQFENFMSAMRIPVAVGMSFSWESIVVKESTGNWIVDNGASTYINA